ncbi:MAG: ABC transporter ATP-binding protein [Bacillota bacterium]
MLKLIRYFKPFLILILSIVALLFIQAICDLTLPDYMSRIVNTGIQTSGIENAVPQVIRQSEWNKVMLFMSKEDKELAANNYVLLDKAKLSTSEYEKQVKDYPALKDTPVYKLNTTDSKIIDGLNPGMAKAELAVQTIEKATPEQLMKMMQGMQPSGQTDNGASGMPQGNMPAIKNGSDVLKMLQGLPQEKLDAIREQMDKNFDVMGKTTLIAAATGYVKAEYQAIGINTDAIQSNYILNTGVAMLLIALAGAGASIFVSYLAARVAAGFGRDVRRNLFTNVMRFSNNEVNKFSTASLITRTTNDIQQIQLLLVMFLRFVFYAPILGVGGSIKAIDLGGTMAWIIAAAVGVILVFIGVLFIVVMPRFKLMQRLTDRLNLVLRQSLNGMPVIRAFNRQRTEEEKFDVENTHFLKTGLFVNRTMSLMMPVLMIVMNGVMLLIVWVGSHAVNDGTLQVGNMMALMQYSMQIIMAFLFIAMVAIMMPRASVAANRIHEVLKTRASIHDPKEPRVLPENDATVEFRNVTFAYPGADEPVLRDISFTARPGQTTAFIGSTGSGKSTVVSLVPRFYDVTEGQILIGGVDIRDVRQHDLRDKIGYMPEKAVLFSGTIGSNLRYADEDASEEELKKASEIAQAMEFINEKPDRFDSEIAQGGTNVSGGQKQRLSIARAVLKKPQIYIFDDTFSALDFTTDARLRKALRNVTQNSTVLIVAQRIGTIMNAEQIIVLEEGRIAGIGTHKQLLKTCNVYREIAESQLSKEELEHA